MVTNTIHSGPFFTKVSRVIFFTLLVLTAVYASTGTASAQSANITVSTSRNPVSLDDSFQLIYEVNSGFFSGGVDDDPDFSPIDKNFDILSSSQTMSSSYINGTWKQTKAWKLTVIAKSVGKFTIPPIHFGSDVSPAIQVTITSSSSVNRSSPDSQATIPAKIFLETFMDKKQGWIESQFIFTVRLLRTVSIASASLTEPVTNDSDAITKLIDESRYQTTRNGIRYDVIERRYSVFPQKSGTLKISPLTFEGRVNPTQPRTIFDQFRMSGQLKRLRSKPVEVQVKAVPSDINLQDWLPAKELILSEEWSDDIQNLKTGEPVTRTITIIAEGLTAVQLPELKFAEIDGLKQYPDKAVSEDGEDRNGITGIKQFKVALIPGKAGDYTLP
ncbi:MAG: BatD family protein, partial [Proteobacteria bacterium]|nr:BatD family protein [Pseudomonadota bacterium]